MERRFPKHMLEDKYCKDEEVESGMRFETKEVGGGVTWWGAGGQERQKRELEIAPPIQVFIFPSNLRSPPQSLVKHIRPKYNKLWNKFTRSEGLFANPVRT